MAYMFNNCKKLKLNDNNFMFKATNAENMEYMFNNCNEITSLKISNFDSTKLTNMAYMFSDCQKLSSLDLNLNTQYVVNMDHTFNNCNSVRFLDLSHFDTSLVKTMCSMFNNCENLNLKSKFNTVNVENMENMFNNCKSMTSLDTSRFDNSKATTMASMFNNCNKLVSLDLSRFITLQVSNIDYMFNNCKSLTSLDISQFDTSLVTNMAYLFNNCEKLTSVDISSFNTNILTSMEKMFYNCYSLTSLDFSNFDTSEVTNMDSVFYGCSKLSSLDLSNFRTPKLNNMDTMFYSCSSLTSLKISEFDTSLITNMASLFNNCQKLTSLDLSSFNTNRLTTMEKMFYNCNSLSSLEFSNFDTSEVTNMDSTFYSCSSFSSLDLSHFRTPKVQTMSNLFNSCSSLTTLDLSNFDTSVVTNMASMFNSCSKIKSLDLSNFRTSNVKNMENMFKLCSSLNSLNIENYDTSSVENMESMFYSCSKITSLDLSKFETSNVKNMESMFKYCTSFTSLDISNFDTRSVTNMISMFDGCFNLEYLNIKKFKEGINVDTTNAIKGTPDNIAYCINDETLTKKISKQFHEKKCEYLDCDFNWKQNLDNLINEIKNGGKNVYSKCFAEDKVNLTENDFYHYNEEPGVSVYSYEIGSSDSLKKEHTNLTFIEFSDAQKRQLLRKFKINENEKLFVYISDLPSDDERTATSDYDYIFMLENGTKLNLNDLNEDFVVTVTVPIRDLDLANFEYAKNFADKGYDIYDKNGDFYINPCTAAYIHKDDIPLKDRKKDIYPNVTICKGSNCQYKEANLDDRRIVCECNLNADKINDTAEEDDYMMTSDKDVKNYVLDNINYRIIKCYYLLLDFKNLVKNPAFYAMVLIFAVVLFLYIKFIFFGIQKIRVTMYGELPTDSKVKELVKKELAKKKEEIPKTKVKKKSKFAPNPPKKEEKKTKKNNVKKKDEIHSENLKGKRKKKQENESSISGFNNTDYFKKVKKSNLKKGNYIDYKTTTDETLIDPKIDNNEDKKDELVLITNNKTDNYNQAPFTQAVREDKRKCCSVFCSLLFDKVEFLHLFTKNEYFKAILICQFLTSLVLDFFFNSFFYSDDIVSRKYHNNGNLDFAVTIALSFVSSIFTAIIMHYLERTIIFEEWLKEIKEIKKEYKYLYALNKFLKYLKIQVFVFFIIEIIIVLWGYYYIVIFFIIYSQSRKSLLLNFLTTIIEGLIKSLIVIVSIVITRRIGIICKSSYIYNTSKYIDEKF